MAITIDVSDIRTVGLKKHGRLRMVLAKYANGSQTAVTYANRTQAERMAAKLTDAGVRCQVIQSGRPFLVEILSKEESVVTCQDCDEPLGDAESMVRNGGKLSHLDRCPTKGGTFQIGPRSLATILAALRHWQQCSATDCEFCGGTGEFIDDVDTLRKVSDCQRCLGTGASLPILEHFEAEDLTPLTSDEIDELCETLNCGEPQVMSSRRLP